MARYLVTGGAGFIGSTITRRLLSEGHTVVVMDNLSTGLASNVPPDSIFIEADLSKPESMSQIPDGRYDAVVHLAAQSSGALSQKAPYLDMQVNVGAAMLLSRWCLDQGIARFLYASSMTVYGQTNREPIPETAPTAPISYYGASKLASEMYLKIASMEGLKPTSLRLYNVYGPGQNLGNLYQGMASIYLAYLLDNVPVPVTGSFDRYRDFCYIDDVVEAFMGALKMSETPSLIYNIGTGQKTTVRSLLATLINAMQLPADYEIQELAGSANDIFGSVASSARAAAELGWQPKIGLDAGIRRMVEWARTTRAAR